MEFGFGLRAIKYDAGDSRFRNFQHDELSGGISIQNIGIGGIVFITTGAQVFDHSINDEVTGCCNVNIRGIIGSNPIKKAISQTDYDRKTIAFC